MSSYLDYDVSTVPESVRDLWKTARQAVHSQVVFDPKSKPIAFWSILQSKSNMTMFNSLPTLSESQKLLYPSFLQSLRIAFVSNKINPRLFVQCVQVKVYDELRTHLDTRLTNEQLRDEQDLLDAFHTLLLSGFSYHVVKANFLAKNAQLRMNGIPFISIANHIREAQLPLLTVLSPHRHTTKALDIQRILYSEFLLAALSPQEKSYLGSQNLLDDPDRLIQAQANLSLFRSNMAQQKQQPIVPNSAINAVDNPAPLLTGDTWVNDLFDPAKEQQEEKSPKEDDMAKEINRLQKELEECKRRLRQQQQQQLSDLDSDSDVNSDDLNNAYDDINPDEFEFNNDLSNDDPNIINNDPDLDDDVNNTNSNESG